MIRFVALSKDNVNGQINQRPRWNEEHEEAGERKDRKWTGLACRGGDKKAFNGGKRGKRLTGARVSQRVEKERWRCGYTRVELKGEDRLTKQQAHAQRQLLRQLCVNEGHVVSVEG